MQGFKYVVGLIALGLTTASASAVITANITLDDTSVPGITQRTMTVDTDSDFLSAVLLVQLTSGAVHDLVTFLGLAFDGDLVIPGSGDTFFTANGNPSTGSPNGAADLDPTAPAAATVDPQFIGVAWFSPGSDTDDIGTGLPLGRFSVTNDAIGTWQLLVRNAAEEQHLISGTIIPEPASLSLITLGGLALLRRQH